MSTERLEENGQIVGDTAFGLVDKDARFARWDARKILRWNGEHPQTLRILNLFEGTTNDDLLERMRLLHESAAKMEADDLDGSLILGRLLADYPDLTDYDLLFRKTAWGKRLIVALNQETYMQNETGLLWNDFVVSRIHRTLGGKLKRYPRYDGRFSYQIDTQETVLRFDPESNARANDGPEFHIRGNRKEKVRESGFDTDQRYMVSMQNVTCVQIREREGKIIVIKDMDENELRLTYRQQPVGSSKQLEVELITKNPPKIN